MRTPKHVYNRIPMPARPGTCRLQVQNLSITLGGEHSPGHLLPAQLPGDRCPHRPQQGGEILPLPEHSGPGPLRRHHPVPPGGGLPRPPQDRLRPPEPQL